MSKPTIERRSQPRRDDPSVRFRWAGAREDESVANFSVVGAKLLTKRSAPVGSLVDLELSHADGSSVSLLAKVRRVERSARRRAEGDRRVSLSVEFVDVTDPARRTLDSWQDLEESSVSESSEGSADAGTGGQLQHKGRLWEDAGEQDTASGVHRAIQASSAVTVEPVAPSSGSPPAEEPESASVQTTLAEEARAAAKLREDQEQLIAELQHRLARAETAASEAQAKLDSAEQRLRHLGVHNDDVEVEAEVELRPEVELQPEVEETGPTGQAPEEDGGPGNQVDNDPASSSTEADTEGSDRVDGEDQVDAGQADDAGQVQADPVDGPEQVDPEQVDAEQGDTDQDDDAEERGETEASDDVSTEPIEVVGVPIMVDAVLESGEFEMVEESEPVEDPEPPETSSVAADTAADADNDAPISAAVRSLAEPDSTAPESSEDDEASASPWAPREQADQAEDDDGPETKAFSQELLEAARAASESKATDEAESRDSTSSEDAAADDSVEDADSDPEAAGAPAEGESPEASEDEGDGDANAQAVDESSEENSGDDDSDDDNGPDSGRFVEAVTRVAKAAQAWPDLDMEPAESAESVSAGAAFESGFHPSATAKTPESTTTDQSNDSAEDQEPATDGSGWALDPEVKALASEMAAEEIEVESAAPAPAGLTCDDLTTREEMVEAMAKGTILRTDRFDRLEPVSRADIQVSDLLRDCDTIQQLEAKARGDLEVDQLHQVLFVFFQRGLIEVLPD